MFCAFFMEDKETNFASAEDAMKWVDSHAKRLGMKGNEAIDGGFAQIFKA